MTLNPLKWWNDRKQKEKESAARAGKASSGNLDASERQAMFRRSQRLPK